MPVIGIIGMGSFGSFAAKVLKEHVSVVVHDKKLRGNEAGVQSVPMSELARAEVIILAVPLSSIRDVLCRLKPLLAANTLLVDVCSVKMAPREIYKDVLPNHHEVLLTHPLFGPESARDDTAGHDLIVTGPVTKKGELAIDFCRNQLGLTVTHVTAEDHDKTMAEVHALTFFIAKALNNMNLDKPRFKTPSFRMLEDLVQYDLHHSDDLFLTMQLGNTFAGEIRNRFVQSITTIKDSLAAEDRSDHPVSPARRNT